MVHKVCSCACVCFWQAVGKPAEQSKALNPIHPFEPRLQEQHLSPSAFHTFITRMLGLISPPVWNVSLWGGPTIHGQAYGYCLLLCWPNACHWYKMCNLNSWICSALLSLQCLSYIWIKSYLIYWIYFSPPWCRVETETAVSLLKQEAHCLLKGCVCSLCFQCIVREGWLYACMHVVWSSWSHPGAAGDQRIICLWEIYWSCQVKCVCVWVLMYAFRFVGNLGLIVCDERKEPLPQCIG